GAKVMPVDEGSKDPSFAAFRNQLQQAVERRDLKFLESVLDPEVKLSFGGDDGLEGFRRVWDEEHWKELGKVLSMGGRFQGAGEFVAPYTFTDFPHGMDPFESVIILGENVPVYTRPDRASRVVGRLSHDAVAIQDWSGTGWYRVRTPARKM